MDQILQFFSSAYMPHGHCYLWLPSILWVNVIADLLIASAYFSIPVILLIIINKRKDNAMRDFKHRSHVRVARVYF